MHLKMLGMLFKLLEVITNHIYRYGEKFYSEGKTSYGRKENFKKRDN